MTLAGSYFKTSAWVISVPLLVYRLAMLAWALWLALALLRWLRWGCAPQGGVGSGRGGCRSRGLLFSGGFRHLPVPQS